MIRLIAVAAFGLAVATSAQAMSPAPLHRPDGMYTQAIYGRGVARRTVRRHYGVGVGVGVGVAYGVGRYYGGRYCPGEYHYWNGVACVDSRGYAYVNRPYVNRGYVNRRYVNRGYVNRGYVNRGYVNRGSVNRVSVNRGHVNRGRWR